ncbi:recombinase family protein [Porticoccus sp. W117]|uniref:recombinase family protein n=1 Tax=Porticoccus sp. W117 TaxID=3054777 RepID=UPI002597878F|nr:recombinase family protein [Porticoccus sp. W117]MDM3871809.1 recombinase family protein [Porticoccus sp. W117]
MQEVKKALIYCRVSSKKQKTTGGGLDSQEHRCRLYAAEKGYEVEKVFPDDVTGAGDFMKRPGMKSLIRYLNRNDHTSYIVIFDDLKRLARDTLAHFQLRHTLMGYEAELECLNYTFEDTPEGEFMETIFAAQGQLERKQNRRQVIQKMKARLENGYWLFSAPVGYEYIRSKTGGKILSPKEPFASMVTEALEGFASGRFQTKAEVKYFLDSFPQYPRDSNGNIRDQRVHDLISNIVYTGYYEYKPWNISFRKGHHKPLISFETFKKNQERLLGVAYAPARKNINADFPLRGFVLCGDCEKPVTGGWSKGRNRYHAYYNCKNKGCSSYGKSIRRDDMEGAFGDLVKSLKPSDKLIKVATRMFNKLWKDKEQLQASHAQSLKSELKRIDQQTNKLLDQILDAELPSVVKAYEKKIKSLEDEKIVIAEKIANIGKPVKDQSQTLRTALDFLSNPYKLWASKRLEDKRAVLKLVFSERLAYVRNEGFRTAITTLPFNKLGDFCDPKSCLVEAAGVE